MLREFDLAHVAVAHPDRLSQGERARLSVARAIASDAESMAPNAGSEAQRLQKSIALLRKLGDTGGRMHGKVRLAGTFRRPRNDGLVIFEARFLHRPCCIACGLP